MRFVAHRTAVAGFAALIAITFLVGGFLQDGGQARAVDASVSIVNLAFVPATVNISVGDTVTWTNNEPSAIPHTVTSDTAGQFDSGIFNPPQTFAHTFTTAGTFAYHCNVHPTMHGTVVVAAAVTATATTPATTTTATATTPPATATTPPPTATPTTPVATATTPSAPTQPANAPINLTLSGANEVPPVTTTATGNFRATVSANSLAFTLTATGTGFTMAHIHQGAAGTNGPIVAFLFGPVSPGVNSINVSGTITEANLIGPLQGDMAGFMAALRAGNLYVNAHTVANPAGEIRAQIPGAAPAPSAPATGTGSTSSSGSNAPLFFVLAGLAGVVAIASGAAEVVRRRR